MRTNRNLVGRVRAGMIGATRVRSWSIHVYPEASIEDYLNYGHLEGPRFIVRCPFPHSFWADPCIAQTDEGVTWIFVEEFQRWIGKGKIAAFKWSEFGPTDYRVVLSGPHHYAFPSVVRQATTGSWLATADTCDCPQPFFSFAQLGDPWVRVDQENLYGHLTDPQLGESSHVYEIWATDWFANEDAELSIWRGGPLSGWVKQGNREFTRGDCRSGGTLDLARGLRATQHRDQGVYGKFLTIDEIGANDASTLPKRIEPSDFGFDGVHTISWLLNGRGVVLDGWTYTPSLLGAPLHLRDLAHLKKCRRSCRRRHSSKTQRDE